MSSSVLANHVAESQIDRLLIRFHCVDTERELDPAALGCWRNDATVIGELRHWLARLLLYEELLGLRQAAALSEIFLALGLFMLCPGEQASTVLMMSFRRPLRSERHAVLDGMLGGVVLVAVRVDDLHRLLHPVPGRLAGRPARLSRQSSAAPAGPRR